MEDIGPVLQDLHCSQVRIYHRVEDPQDLLDPLDLQDQVARICPEEELQGRRSIPVSEGHPARSCIPEDRRARHQVEEAPEAPEPPEAGLLPYWREEPDRAGGAGSEDSDWSRPFGRASSGSGVTATEREA